jgi:hypothetical protein
MLLLLLLNGG